jgi:hypothetical protein
MKYALIALLALTSVASAQTTSAQIVSQQIGNLVIQNANYAQQVSELQAKIVELQKQADSCKKPEPKK